MKSRNIDIHFEGNAFECIEEGLAFVLTSIDWKVKISGEARRMEEPEIPQAAIREMIVNAFAHGCYYANTSWPRRWARPRRRPTGR